MLKILKKRWYFIVVIVAALGLFLYNRSNSQAKAKSAKTEKVHRTDLKDTLSLSGNIDANEKVTLRFQTSGNLAWVGVKEGDYVKKYQTIASLDQRALQKNLEIDLNNFMSKRWSYDQIIDNYKGAAITDAMKRVLDQSQFDLNNSILNVEIQDISKQYANLWTPIDGIVTRVEAPYSGVNITPAQAEFDVVNPDTIYFASTADQTDVVKLHKGMTADIALDAYPDRTIHGTITEISFTPDTSQTGTVYDVKIGLSEDNSLYAYKVGMTGDSNFTLREIKNVIAIPTSSIKSELGKKYVMKSDKGNAIKTYITTGEEVDTSTIIKSGLQEGDIIYD